MKTVSIILAVFLALAFIWLGATVVTGFSAGPAADPARDQPQQDAPGTADAPDTAPVKTRPVTDHQAPEQAIESIQFYLNGPKQSGLLLGETTPDMAREDMQQLYGEPFLETGFAYDLDLSGLELDAGTHLLFVYAFTGEDDYDYRIKELVIEGPRAQNQLTINVDAPPNLSVVEPQRLDVQGWALDENAAADTGIKDLEIYLNGPRDTGTFLGDGSYGNIPREDVADIFGPQFVQCGFRLNVDAADLSPMEKHYLYIYAQKEDLSWEQRVSQFYIYDPQPESHIFLEIDNYIGDFRLGGDRMMSIMGTAFYINDPQAFYARPDYESKEVVFVSDRAGGGYFDLYISNLDGSNMRKLTDNTVDDLYPNTSPDGKQITFTSEVDGLWQLFVVNIDGTGLRQITTSNTLNAYSDWSHCGQYLFYESRVGDVWELYRIGVDGSNPTRLTFNTESHDWHPATHPFRPKVLFETGSPEDFKIMDYHGDHVHEVTIDDQRNRVPYFSSDGRTIVYSRYLGAQAEVFIMDINGEILAQITAMGGTNTHPIFSPCDRYIGFDSNISGKEQVYIYSFEDGTIFNVVNDLEHNYKDPCFVFE